eukprot:1155333-Pelagomonas_calceolata.AAC.9
MARHWCSGTKRSTDDGGADHCNLVYKPQIAQCQWCMFPSIPSGMFPYIPSGIFPHIPSSMSSYMPSSVLAVLAKTICIRHAPTKHQLHILLATRMPSCYRASKGKAIPGLHAFPAHTKWSFWHLA